MALVDRVKNILLSPKTEWATIAGEPATVQSLYVGYILILAAIGPIAMAIRMGAYGATAAVASYVMALISPLLVAWVVDVLAPSFGGEKNFAQSLKLVAYSSTVTWIAGIAHLLPGLGVIIGLIALIYSLYTFYLGVPVIKKCPADKAVTYTVVVVVCWIILAMLIGAVMMPLFYGGGVAGLGLSQ